MEETCLLKGHIHDENKKLFDQQTKIDLNMTTNKRKLKEKITGTKKLNLTTEEQAE